MKRISFLLLACGLILTLSLPGAALADSSSPTWNSIIYYYNPLANSGSMGVTFTSTGTIPVDKLGIPVPAHGFGQVMVGSTGDFKGAATLSADVPLAAVYKQYAAGAYAPVLYSSFNATQFSVNGTFYLPSVLHAGYYVSRVGIQNVENEAVTLTLHFYDSTGTEKVNPPLGLTKSIDSQGSWIFQILDDAADVPGIGSSFDGSLVIDAFKADSTPARVVAAVEDLQSQGQRSYAYEGSGATATAFYMPYANCRYSTNQLSSTFYVQNAGSADTAINVYYYTTGGVGITYYTTSTMVKPGARMLVSACDSKVYAKMNGKNGTARITSTTQPLVVIGKMSSTDGLSTAFLGQPSGGTDILLPYVEYSKLSSGLRATLSIMNVSSSTATNVYINYWYKKSDGTYAAQKVTVATSSAPLAKYGKYTASPKVSGAALDFNGNYLGAAEVISDQPVVVVVRLTQSVTGVPGITTLGEDYTGVPFAAGP